MTDPKSIEQIRLEQMARRALMQQAPCPGCRWIVTWTFDNDSARKGKPERCPRCHEEMDRVPS